MMELPADDVERMAVSEAWEVVKAYWLPLRQTGWVVRPPEVENYRNRYVSELTVLVDGEDKCQEAVSTLIYDCGIPSAWRYAIRALVGSTLAGILRDGSAASPPSSRSVRSSQWMAAIDGCTLLRPDQMDAVRQLLSLEDGGPQLASEVATGMLLHAIAERATSAEKLTLDEEGERAWAILLEIPVGAMHQI